MKPSSRTQPSPAPSSVPNGAAILVVDDNPANLVAMEVLLQGLGYDIVLANSGSDALKHLSTIECACVLLDVRMEGIDGFETAALIRKRESWASLPIVFVTCGEPTLLEYSQAYALGAVDFVRRPVDPGILRGKIRAVSELYRGRERAHQERDRESRELFERLELVANSVPALVSYVDAEERYVYVNRAYEKWFGLPRSQVEGRHLREVLGEVAYAGIRPRVERALAGERVTYDFQMPYKTGGTRFITADYVPHLAADGHVKGFIALVNDISERRQQEERQTFLAEAGALISSTLDPRGTLETMARLAVPRMADWCVVDLLAEDGTVERVRMVHEGLAGLERAAEYMKARPVSLEELHGIGAVLRTGEPELVPWIPDLAGQTGAWHPEDARLIADLGLRSVLIVPLKGRERILGAVTFLTAESERRYGPEDLTFAQELSKRAALALENGLLYHRVKDLNSKLSSLVDQRTRELADSRGRYEVLSLISPVGIFRTDAQGDCVELNQRTLEITGLEYSKALGQGWVVALHPEDRDRVSEEWLSALRKSHPFRSEYRLLRPDGTLSWVLGQATALKDSSGAVTGYIGTLTDITDRKAKEEAILDAGAELSKANRELEAFAYSLAHDLRTPLRSMVGMGQILLEDYPQKILDQEGQGFAQNIVSTGIRLDQMIRDLLTYAQVARVDAHVSAIELEAAVDEVLEELRHDLSATKARIERGTLPGPVLANPLLLKQVLTNLIYNGAKFVRPGVPAVIRISGSVVGSMVRVSIDDNGIGIAPADRAKLFKMFTRLNARDAYPGTGLGLALVKRAVERLGGQVGVDAGPDGGSRFWFELPKA